jgi:hypothetical protein
MATILEEALEIVEAGFGSFTLAVNSQDPLTGSITVKNNSLDPLASEAVGFLLGLYNASDQTFSVLIFTAADGTQFAVGCVQNGSMPAAGAQKVFQVPSYAVPVSETMTLDVLVFIMPTPSQLQAYAVDWGKGTRVIGLKKTDFDNLVSTILAAKWFTSALTIAPPVAPADILAFTLAKI